MNDTEYQALQDDLAAAETELDTLDEQTRATYRAYRDANERQDAKAIQVRALRQKIRETVIGGA